MSNSPTHSETTRRSLLRSAVGAGVAASAGFAGAAAAREEGTDLDDVGPEKVDLGAPEGGAAAQTDSGESEESGEGSGSGGHAEGSGIEIHPGVVPMFLAGVAAFLSPLVFAVLLFLNRDDDERPSERGEIEYRPGTEH